MLHALSWFTYFLLVLLGAMFLFVSGGESGWVLGREIGILFTVLLLPVFDRIFQVLAKEKIFQADIFDMEKYIAHYIIIGWILFTLWYGWLEMISLFFGALFLVWIVFQMNPKIPFIGSLVVFIYIPFFLILKENTLAEELSIYAYYFLILGVVFQIAESVAPKIAKLWK